MPNTINEKRELRNVREKQLQEWKTQQVQTTTENTILGKLQPRKEKKVERRSIPELCRAIHMPNTINEKKELINARKISRATWEDQYPDLVVNENLIIKNPKKMCEKNKLIVNVQRPRYDEVYQSPHKKICKALSIPNSTEERNKRELVREEMKRKYYDSDRCKSYLRTPKS